MPITVVELSLSDIQGIASSELDLGVKDERGFPIVLRRSRQMSALFSKKEVDLVVPENRPIVAFID